MTVVREALPHSLLIAVVGLVLAASPALAQGGAKAVVRQLQLADESIQFVETQYSKRPDPTNEQTKQQRFTDGEVQYLLGDWRTATVLFYDLVSDSTFRAGPRYADALFYLSDALYQQDNVIGARLYLRDLLQLDSPHFQPALSRYLEVAPPSARSAELEGWIERARQRSRSGQLSPELTYAYGRAIFRRGDLPLTERLSRVRALYAPLTGEAGGALRLPASYILGVLHVQTGELEQAAAQFQQVSSLPVQTARDAEIRELSLLAQGRVLRELGRYDDAVDRYNQVERQSERFIDALYEVAWTQVKKGDFERARNATEILLLAAPESQLAPSARLLQSNLLLKLGRYEDATASYHDVINEYAPVRDELEALLNVHQDPVAYFDALLARNKKALDVNTLIPEVARRFATTQEEVANGLRMVNDLEAGREGLADSARIAHRIRDALEHRGLEVFPDLMEGYQRADAVDTSLTQLERDLILAEETAARRVLTPEELRTLEALVAERQALQLRVQSLPRTREEVQARRERMQQQVDALDKTAFTLGYEIQASHAMTSALRKWVADTRPRRKNTPEEEENFLTEVQTHEEDLGSYEAELIRVREQLSDEKQRAGASLEGEESLKAQLASVLQRQHRLFESAAGRAGGGELDRVLLDARPLHAQIASIRGRTVVAKQALREKLFHRSLRIRDMVAEEERLLGAHAQEVASVGGDTRNLVGRIAFDSFQRVHQQFYELVLKADVGVVDVAFTRKQDHTQEIQRLSAQKDQELRRLDSEFSEVLGEDTP